MFFIDINFLVLVFPFRSFAIDDRIINEESLNLLILLVDNM